MKRKGISAFQQEDENLISEVTVSFEFFLIPLGCYVIEIATVLFPWHDFMFNNLCIGSSKAKSSVW